MSRAGSALHRVLASLHHAAGAARWRSSCRPSPLLTAAPSRALIDEQISITGHFLPPHCPVTVCSKMHCDDGDQWEAYAHYTTDADGTVSLSRDHSVGGMYVGCEPMGLFWGLKPAPGAREGLRLRKKNVETPYLVHISLLEGHVCPSEGPSTELAAVMAERWYMAPGVRRTEIRQNGLVGTLFLPPGPGPFPAMLDLWGMGGGLVEYRSALLASRGYASFTIAYIGHKDLPGPKNCISVGDPYFKSAFHFLQDHHQVCGDRVGLFGLSFGTYLCLRLATQPDVNPSCLICVNGPVGSLSKLSDPDGRTEDFERDQTYWLYDDQERVSFKNVSLPANINPDNIVKIENLKCPLAYIVGEDDVSCASIDNANLIEETLRAAGKPELFTRLSYPGAGHLIEPPYAPNSRMSMWRIKPQKLMTVWGGHPAPHAAAQEDAWRKVLDFMARHLRR
ncbi:peroxisomal succinyl-coenzyme A thioesterase-like [Betta splendens]|uniref:Peroxisomal succinyl-coenzyme A thioesterase-like n=1 Tax=Betta splendens TaxID=158456 RepID=A0A6P7MLH8_BETSP|nr:peroxisomal succinyl-coenzyme A thioesterase-like [Betta splendens]